MGLWRPFLGRPDLSLAVLWTGHDSHLSYGEFIAEVDSLNEIQSWIRARGEMIGGMTAPLKFAAASPSGDIAFTPTVTLKKTWDGRWLHGLIGFLLMAALVKAGDHWLVKKFVTTQATSKKP